MTWNNQELLCKRAAFRDLEFHCLLSSGRRHFAEKIERFETVVPLCGFGFLIGGRIGNFFNTEVLFRFSEEKKLILFGYLIGLAIMAAVSAALISLIEVLQ